MRRTLVGLVALAALGACTGASADGPAGTGDPAGPGASASADGRYVYDFDLTTHCGIYELTYKGRWYVRAEGRLDDGSGNPPSGWDNPMQRGTLAVDGDEAVFADGAGHRERFVLRPGAKGPLRMCR